MTVCKCNMVKEIRGGEGEYYAKDHLVLIKVHDIEWTALYQCPETGRLWKEFFPFPEAHGCGPADFIQITVEEARKEFKI